MRELKTKDIFALAKIIRKMDLRNELATLEFNQNEVEKLGVQLFWLLVENMEKAEEDIKAFFADIAGVTAQEFDDWSLEQLADFIDELKQQKGLGRFFGSALAMSNQK